MDGGVVLSCDGSGGRAECVALFSNRRRALGGVLSRCCELASMSSVDGGLKFVFVDGFAEAANCCGGASGVIPSIGSMSGSASELGGRSALPVR